MSNLEETIAEWENFKERAFSDLNLRDIYFEWREGQLAIKRNKKALDTIEGGPETEEEIGYGIICEILGGYNRETKEFDNG